SSGRRASAASTRPTRASAHSSSASHGWSSMSCAGALAASSPSPSLRTSTGRAPTGPATSPAPSRRAPIRLRSSTLRSGATPAGRPAARPPLFLGFAVLALALALVLALALALVRLCLQRGGHEGVVLGAQVLLERTRFAVSPAVATLGGRRELVLALEIDELAD